MRLFNSFMSACFVVFIAYFFVNSFMDTKKKREAAVEAAIRAGRTVTAVRKKVRGTTMSVPGTHEFWSSIGIYEYEYKGRTYKYKYWADNPPATLKLYFIKKPSKATVAGALNPVTVRWPLVYVAVTAFFYIFLYR